jgi:hypothetical protein
MEKKALASKNNSVLAELFKFLRHTSADESWKTDKREINEKVKREIYTQNNSTWIKPKFNLN